MAKTIDQLTIEELQAELNIRLERQKNEPILRQERDKILKQIQDIDNELASLGAPIGKTSGRKPSYSSATAFRASRPKTIQVNSPTAMAILNFIGSRDGAAMRPSEIADLNGFDLDDTRQALNVLVESGRIETEQGVYWLDPNKAQAAPVKAKRQTGKKAGGKRSSGGGPSVKQTMLDFLGRTNDFYKTSEIRQALPGVAPQYIYNLLNILRKEGVVVREADKWGLRLPS